MKNSINNRKLTVMNAAREDGFKVMDMVEHSIEVENWILSNTVKFENLPNGATLEAVIVNGKFIDCEYYNKDNSKTLTEVQFLQAKKAFNV